MRWNASPPEVAEKKKETFCVSHLILNPELTPGRTMFVWEKFNESKRKRIPHPVYQLDNEELREAGLKNFLILIDIEDSQRASFRSKTGEGDF